MLITKFNRLIRNRVLWGIFAALVIFSFVGWGTSMRGCDSDKAAKRAKGTIGEEDVTSDELAQAKFNTYISLCLMLGRQIPTTPELAQELDEQSWRRVAALRTARTLGLAPTDQEVLDAIRRDPQFSESGVFVRPRYDAFIRGPLASLGAGESQFESQIRENIMLQKLQMLLSSAAWVAPSEMRRTVAMYADSFQLKYVTLSTNSLTAPVTVSEEQARAFFEANTNRFLVPPKVAVRYVQFAYSNYIGAVTVSLEEVQAYYDENVDEFAVTDTNDVQTARPLEEVAGTISNTLLDRAAMVAARDAATAVVVDLAPNRSGSQTPFEAVAAQYGLPVHTTALFTLTDEVAGIDAGADLNRSAFQLRATPDESFSDAIAGEAHVYVLSFLTNTEEYLPAFETVRDEAAQLAREEAMAKAVLDRARAVRESLQAALATPAGFEGAAAAAGLPVTTTQVFTAYTCPEELGSEEFLQDVTSRRTGELTDVLPATNGVLVALVAERKDAEPEAIVAVRDQVTSNVSRRRARMVFSDWEESQVRLVRRFALDEGAEDDDASRDVPIDPPIVD